MQYFVELREVGRHSRNVWRWDGETLQSGIVDGCEPRDSWMDSLFDSPYDLNVGYVGTSYEAVEVDEHGNRIENNS